MGRFFKKLFKKQRFEANSDRIVVAENDYTGAEEGYNRLKDNLLYINADGTKKVIQIESAMPEEGKTTVAANLAVSLGFNDKKIVVIDLDFRKPQLHRKFDLPRENGIAEYMRGEITKEKVVKKSKYKNVDVVTRGGNIYNPSLILTSQKFKDFIAELKNEYDYVLLDCAPVLQVSDFIHIIQVSDGALLVVAYGYTTKNQVAEAVKDLKQNGCNILGSVFSKYDIKKDKYGGVYYYKKKYIYAEQTKENVKK